VSPRAPSSSRNATAAVERADLRATLLEHAVDLTRGSGPDSVSLREVQRRSGVSPAAAYRHYRDRDALMVAVGQRASAMLADRIQQAIDSAELGTNAPHNAIARLHAGARAYINFALQEPGLYRAVFLTDENPAVLETPAFASRGAGGLGPYQLLQQCLQEMSGAGLLAKERAAWSDTTVWAASHGIALLLLDSPLGKLDEAQQHDAIERLLEVVIAGLTDHRVRDISNPKTHETLPIGADENDA
jgi:AcrR family transcriptional regulator